MLTTTLYWAILKDMSYKELRCHSSNHNIKSAGGILLIAKGPYLYAKCNDRGCKKWTRIGITIPGVKANFDNAAFETKPMPDNFVFNKDLDGKMNTVPLITEV